MAHYSKRKNVYLSISSLGEVCIRKKLPKQERTSILRLTSAEAAYVRDTLKTFILDNTQSEAAKQFEKNKLSACADPECKICAYLSDYYKQEHNKQPEESMPRYSPQHATRQDFLDNKPS